MSKPRFFLWFLLCRMWSKRNLCAIIGDTVRLKGSPFWILVLLLYLIASLTTIVQARIPRFSPSLSQPYTPWPWLNTCLLLEVFIMPLHLPLDAPQWQSGLFLPAVSQPFLSPSCFTSLLADTCKLAYIIYIEIFPLFYASNTFLKNNSVFSLQDRVQRK